jgi:hypothetical protein
LDARRHRAHVALLILTTKTGQSFKKRYFARLWDEAKTKANLQSVTLPGSERPVGRHFHDLRDTTLSRAVREVVGIGRGAFSGNVRVSFHAARSIG